MKKKLGVFVCTFYERDYNFFFDNEKGKNVVHLNLVSVRHNTNKLFFLVAPESSRKDIFAASYQNDCKNT